MPSSPRANRSIDYLDVLRRALGDCTGTLRVSDAFLICGIEPGKANQAQISGLGRAIRELGWERKRRRLNGSVQYAYAKGTPEQREVVLAVEHEDETTPFTN